MRLSDRITLANLLRREQDATVARLAPSLVGGDPLRPTQVIIPTLDGDGVSVEDGDGMPVSQVVDLGSYGSPAVVVSADTPVAGGPRVAMVLLVGTDLVVPAVVSQPMRPYIADGVRDVGAGEHVLVTPDDRTGGTGWSLIDMDRPAELEDIHVPGLVVDDFDRPDGPVGMPQIGPAPVVYNLGLSDGALAGAGNALWDAATTDVSIEADWLGSDYGMESLLWGVDPTGRSGFAWAYRAYLSTPGIYQCGDIRTPDTWVLIQAVSGAAVGDRVRVDVIGGVAVCYANGNPLATVEVPSPATTYAGVRLDYSSVDNLRITPLSVVPESIQPATATQMGVVRLTGDLGGTASAPQVVSGEHHTHTADQVVGVVRSVNGVTPDPDGDVTVTGGGGGGDITASQITDSTTVGRNVITATDAAAARAAIGAGVGTVKTVNGATPDAAGNVVVTGGGGSLPTATAVGQVVTWDGTAWVAQAPSSASGGVTWTKVLDNSPMATLDGWTVRGGTWTTGGTYGVTMSDGFAQLEYTAAQVASISAVRATIRLGPYAGYAGFGFDVPGSGTSAIAIVGVTTTGLKTYSNGSSETDISLPTGVTTGHGQDIDLYVVRDATNSATFHAYINGAHVATRTLSGGTGCIKLVGYSQVADFRNVEIWSAPTTIAVDMPEPA